MSKYYYYNINSTISSAVAVLLLHYVSPRLFKFQSDSSNLVSIELFVPSKVSSLTPPQDSVCTFNSNEIKICLKI